MKRYFLLAFSVLIVLATVPQAQMRVAPVDDVQGHVALGLALRHLGNAGVFMMATAHPDDEDNGLLVMLNRGEGYRTALASATRGNGGQNEIGPEIFEALAVLRTEELAAMHRFDGAEQYFTRAVDFGYTVSLEETFEKWGREEITGDFVRLIRTIRPDVIAAMSPFTTGPGQHQHHTASAIMARDAFKLAGDPTKYPDQIREGLRPWQPKKLYFRVGFGGPPPSGVKTTRCDLAVYDSLLGKTYAEVGTEARSMHKCQGQAQLLALPGPVVQNYQLGETTLAGAMERDEKSLFDGIDTSLAGLATFAGARAPKELVDGLAAVAANVQTAQKKFDSESDAATVPPLVAGLHAVRALLGQLRAMAIDDGARYEIEPRLRQKEREFQQALLAANGVRVETLADDGVVVPGQPVTVAVIVANRGQAEVTVKQIKFEGFGGDAACSMAPVTAGGRGGGAGEGRGGAAPSISTLRKGQTGRCESTVTVPGNAGVTAPYWHRQPDLGRYVFDADAPFGLPFRPTPFVVRLTLTFPGGEDVVDESPVQFRYEGNIFSGEKRTELIVVPAVSVRVSPDVMIVPAVSVRGIAPAAAAAAGSSKRTPEVPASREIRVTVVNNSPVGAQSAVTLDVPKGWTISPAEEPVTFTRQDESKTVRFQIRPTLNTASGEYHVTARASLGGQKFDRGYQVIEYPHISRRHVYDAAAVRLKVIDVKTQPNLSIGYVMGTGDQVPAAIEQLGAKVEMLGPEALAWADLARFDTIVLGIRAYERREDLRANNSRMLDYVRNGGTLIVQYNRVQPTVPEFGPYPGRVTNNRITDERAPVRILEPAHPVFTTPNKLGESAWSGWVQERGLNFIGEKDARYRDLVELEDPFPNNTGMKRGALVEATYGKGRWLYVGLGLWRELPAGVDGAYQILANLLSLGKSPSTPEQR